MLLLVFSMQGTSFGIPLEEVDYIAENVSCMDTTTTSGHIRGTTMLRGEVVCIYSLAARFDYEKSNHRETVIVISSGDKKLAIEVEKIDGIKFMEEFIYADMPPIIQKENICIKYVVGYQDDIILVIDTEKLLAEA